MSPALSIALFGLIGIFSRYGVDRFFVTINSHFPMTTFLINILGSLIAGCLYIMSDRLNPELHTGLLVGFCGGFTTFSAYSLQTLMMIEKGKFFPGILYLTLSPILGLAAAALPLVIRRYF